MLLTESLRFEFGLEVLHRRTQPAGVRVEVLLGLPLRIVTCSRIKRAAVPVFAHCSSTRPGRSRAPDGTRTNRGQLVGHELHARKYTCVNAASDFVTRSAHTCGASATS